jgi:tRNA G10  N-methylase Trm11
MILCILGRQTHISLAELDSLYPNNVEQISKEAALVEADAFDIEQLGGTQKAGIVELEIPSNDWRAVSSRIQKHYETKLKDIDYKVTIGMSVYGFDRTRPKDITQLGIKLKQTLKQGKVSVRLIPNNANELNTAVSHHNKLGLSQNKIELLIVRSGVKTIVAESTGGQNITAYARRDQERPARDAFIGMLPPKLAQIMINLALGAPDNSAKNILDPFCGTGVVLQEGVLKGHNVYGSDLNPKMVDYTIKNLNWLKDTHSNKAEGTVMDIREGDAMKFKWEEANELDAVVCETYLGQPFSATPSPSKLTEVRRNCNHIVDEFLKNIASQITPGAKLCVAVPAWRDIKTGRITRLPLALNPDSLHGLIKHNHDALLYYREDQVVARDILIFEKK